jgi:hypothetical protein
VKIQKTLVQDARAIQGRIQGYSRVDTGAIQVKYRRLQSRMQGQFRVGYRGTPG